MLFEPPGNEIPLGTVDGDGRTLRIGPGQRDKHLYVVGATGTGKTKFLENLIREDIMAWPFSKCGLLLLDPHGTLYDDTMGWLAEYKLDRPVVPIDLRRDDWIVAYNLLRARKAAAAVIVDQLVEAIAHVWGKGNVEETPRFARWANAFFHAIFEKGGTITDFTYLSDRTNRRLREVFTEDLKNLVARYDWEFANSLTPVQLDAMIESTLNRLRPFLNNETLRLMFGQPDVSLDLLTALEEGHIVLVNLATEGARISDDDAKLFARLLLADLWTAARERGKGTGDNPRKPFYVYMDEFQNFITPTIARSLDQARGFGLHFTMAHQYLSQLTDEGPAGIQLFHSVMNNARNKAVFCVEHAADLEPVADWLFRGTMSPDKIKLALYSTKVMDYRLEYVEGSSSTASSGTGYSRSEGTSQGRDPEETELDYEQESDGEAWSESYSESTTTTRTPMLMPIMGKELSSVQFESLEEQMFRAMAVLFDQAQRHAVVRLDGMKRPVSIQAPNVPDSFSSATAREEMRQHYLSRWPFVLSAEESRKRLEARDRHLQDEIAGGPPAKTREPRTSKRRVK